MKVEKLLLLSLAVACLAGCGGGGGSRGVTAVPGVMPNAQRMAIVQNIVNAANTLPNTNGLLDSNVLLAKLQQIQGLTNLQIAPDGCVIGFFTDGVPYTFVNNLPFPDSTTGFEHRSGRAAPNVPAESRPSVRELPGASAAVLMDSKDPFLFRYRHDADDALFNANGYPGTALRQSTTDMLRYLGTANQAPIGCLCLQGHGLMSYERNQTTQVGWGAWTATPLSSESPQDSQDMLNGDLGVATAYIDGPNPPVPFNLFTKKGTNFVILPKFITDKGWRLASGSIVFLTMCEGGTAEAADFRNALMANHKATTVAGYTGDISAAYMYPVQTYFVARMLGASLTGLQLPNISPALRNDGQGRRRPFPYDAIKPILDANLIDSNGTVQLSFFVVANPCTILNPALDYVEVTQQGTLALYGSFGQTHGAVSVGSTALSYSSWGPNQIIATLPPGVSGDVVVTTSSPGSGVLRKTNARQLTLWQGTITDTLTGQSGSAEQTAKGVFSMKFRQDVGQYYATPTSALSYPLQSNATAFEGVLDLSSSCAVTCQTIPNWTYVGGSPVSAASMLTYLAVPPGGGSGGSLSFMLDVNNGLSNNGAGFDLYLRNFVSDESVATSFSNGYTMAAGSSSFHEPLSWLVGTDTYSWSAFTATSPPTTNPAQAR